MRIPLVVPLIIVSLAGALAVDLPAEQGRDDLSQGRFRWTVGPPLLEPAERPHDPCYSVKDPTFIRDRGQWHLFCTIRSQKRTHQIEYLSFAERRSPLPAR